MTKSRLGCAEECHVGCVCLLCCYQTIKPPQLCMQSVAGPLLHITAAMEIPPNFLCPIRLEVMRDPVSTEDGYSYERADIERWFEDGNTISPLTGKQLSSLTLVPNHALRGSIETFLMENKALAVRLQTARHLHRQVQVKQGSRITTVRKYLDPINFAILRDPVCSACTTPGPSRLWNKGLGHAYRVMQSRFCRNSILPRSATHCCTC